MPVTELPTPPVVWLTRQEAAEYTKLSIQTLGRALRAGELEHSGGGQGVVYRIRLDKLDEWLARRGRR